MFYEGETDHGLPVNPFKACIAPRPIGWISTLGADGVPNLAPYSFFNAVSESPRMVMIGVNGDAPGGSIKDTLSNVIAVPEFAVNVASFDLREKMNMSSKPCPPDVDEFAAAELEKEPARLIRVPLVREARIKLECLLHDLVELPSAPTGTRNVMILGRVIGIHIDDAVMSGGRIRMDLLRPIGRLGYSEYVVVDARNESFPNEV